MAEVDLTGAEDVPTPLSPHSRASEIMMPEKSSFPPSGCTKEVSFTDIPETQAYPGAAPLGVLGGAALDDPILDLGNKSFRVEAHMESLPATQCYMDAFSDGGLLATQCYPENMEEEPLHQGADEVQQPPQYQEELAETQCYGGFAFLEPVAEKAFLEPVAEKRLQVESTAVRQLGAVPKRSPRPPASPARSTPRQGKKRSSPASEAQVTCRSAEEVPEQEEKRQRQAAAPAEAPLVTPPRRRLNGKQPPPFPELKLDPANPISSMVANRLKVISAASSAMSKAAKRREVKEPAPPQGRRQKEPKQKPASKKGQQKPAVVAMTQQENCQWLQEVGHTLRPPEMGQQVLVRGDGWGNGEGSFYAVVTEADNVTFTVVAIEGPRSVSSPAPWSQLHVLRDCCRSLGLSESVPLSAPRRTAARLAAAASATAASIPDLAPSAAAAAAAATMAALAAAAAEENVIEVECEELENEECSLPTLKEKTGKKAQLAQE